VLFLVASCAELAKEVGPAWDDLPPVRPAPDDWPCWRGWNQDNIAPGPRQPPLRRSATENVVWRADVPGRGHGSPALWGDHLLLATADDKAQTQSVLCYDRRTGARLWGTEVHRGGFVQKHAKNSHASATPACDGERVFVPFAVQGSLWLSALGLDGQRVCQKRLGDFLSIHGFGTLPIPYRSLVIILPDHVKGSFLIAFHRSTGGDRGARRAASTPVFCTPCTASA